MATMEMTTGQQASVPNPRSLEERIAVLEERTRHLATKSDLHRVAVANIVINMGITVGLVIHLHNMQMALIERLMGS